MLLLATVGVINIGECEASGNGESFERTPKLNTKVNDIII